MDFMDTQQAAAYLGINTEVLRRLCRQGKGPAYTRRPGIRGYQFTEIDLDTWLANGRQRSEIMMNAETWLAQADAGIAEAMAGVAAMDQISVRLERLSGKVKQTCARLDEIEARLEANFEFCEQLFARLD